MPHSRFPLCSRFRLLIELSLLATGYLSIMGLTERIDRLPFLLGWPKRAGEAPSGWLEWAALDHDRKGQEAAASLSAPRSFNVDGMSSMF